GDVHSGEPGGVESRFELVAIPLAHRDRVFLGAVALRRTDRHADGAVGVVDGVDAGAERDLAVRWVAPVAYAPLELSFLVVEDEPPSGEKCAMEPGEAGDVLLPRRTEAEDAAADDRGVLPRWVELVQRRDPERRVGDALPAAVDHVGGHVAAVHVEAVLAER